MYNTIIKKSEYVCPELQVILVSSESSLLFGSKPGVTDADSNSKGGNNDFVFDDEDEDDSAEYAQTERQKWPYLLW